MAVSDSVFPSASEFDLMSKEKCNTSYFPKKHVLRTHPRSVGFLS